jgi:hypothetical protein
MRDLVRLPEAPEQLMIRGHSYAPVIFEDHWSGLRSASSREYALAFANELPFYLKVAAPCAAERNALTGVAFFSQLTVNAALHFLDKWREEPEAVQREFLTQPGMPVLRGGDWAAVGSEFEGKIAWAETIVAARGCRSVELRPRRAGR